VIDENIKSDAAPSVKIKRFPPDGALNGGTEGQFNASSLRDLSRSSGYPRKEKVERNTTSLVGESQIQAAGVLRRSRAS
jgi:hypothetical protein